MKWIKAVGDSITNIGLDRDLEQLRKCVRVSARAGAWKWAYDVLEGHSAREHLLNYINWANTDSIKPKDAENIHQEMTGEQAQLLGALSKFSPERRTQPITRAKHVRTEVQDQFLGVMARRIALGAVQDQALHRGFKAKELSEGLRLIELINKKIDLEPAQPNATADVEL